MYPTLPLAPRGYTLHIITLGRQRWFPTQHLARLLRPNGEVCTEWRTTCARWWLKRTVIALRYSLDGLLGSDEALPVYYATIDPPPPRGRRAPRAVTISARAYGVGA
jgi:hypothetical protein